jgi:hypothetical protein
MTGTCGYFALMPAATRSAYGKLNSANWAGDRWCAHESNSWITCGHVVGSSSAVTDTRRLLYRLLVRQQAANARCYKCYRCDRCANITGEALRLVPLLARHDTLPGACSCAAGHRSCTTMASSFPSPRVRPHRCARPAHTLHEFITSIHTAHPGTRAHAHDRVCHAHTCAPLSIW